MISFRIFGIPVRVEPWFWVTMVFIGGGLRANDSLSIMLVGVFALAGFLSILVHELGHALMIRKYGLPTEIALIAFGGYATYPPGRLDRRQSFLVTAAGPGIQLLLGLGLIIVQALVPLPAGSLLGYLLYDLIVVSIVWALFNCLPVYPMDGGQMLASILGPRRQKWVFLTGAVCALAIGLAGYLFLRSWLIPIFMALFAFKNWQDFQNSGGKGRVR